MKSSICIITGSRSLIFQFFRKNLFLFAFLLAFAATNAQTTQNSTDLQGKDGVKGKFVLKPNSREEKVVMRDNKLKRIDKQRRQAAIKKMQQLRQKRMMLMKNDKSRRQEMMQRKKLMMQKRKSLRK